MAQVPFLRKATGNEKRPNPPLTFVWPNPAWPFRSPIPFAEHRATGHLATDTGKGAA